MDVRLAQDAHDPTNKAVLVEMAQTWVKLAEQARDSEPAEGSSEGPDSGQPL